MAAGPWRLDERDQVVPLNCLVPEDKALLERLPRLPDDQRKFSFFAETEDFQELFHQLSKEYGSLLYLEHPPPRPLLWMTRNNCSPLVPDGGRSNAWSSMITAPGPL